MSVLLLLDTSAPLAQPQHCYACFLSRMEVLYRVWKDENERTWRLAYEQLKALPLQWVEASEPLLEGVAAIKARHPLSVADAWIVAAAQHVGATLLHKDPEFRGVADLAQEWFG
jgi:predicted nucleic acid-binding protein